MAESNKLFAGAKSAGKRIPKWAWYVSGGALIAGGIVYLRGGGGGGDETAPGDTYTDEGAVGYTDGQVSPGIIVPPVIGGEAVSGELNTDIPETTLGIFGGIFDTLSGVITDQRADNSDLLGILAAGGSPVQGAPAAGVVTAKPVSAPKPKPKPNPVTRLEAGYHAGSTVNMGPHAQRHFPGAIGWVRIGDGGKGAGHYIDVHVRFCKKLERWRVRPNAKGSPWQKLWNGPRPNIC